MHTFARATCSSKVLYPIILKKIRRPFSCFSFIEKHFKFDAIPIRRLMSQARLSCAQTLVIEILSVSEDIQQEDEDIKKRYPAFRYSRVYRLSFFKKSFRHICSLRKLVSEDFIGYAIVKSEKIGDQFTPWRIYESVFRPWRHDNNFSRGIQNWNCLVGSQTFSVQGYLYAQQNNMTNVCAHVAIRTAASRFHFAGDMSYREMNNLLGVDHCNHKVGDGDGLSLNEMLALLSAAGANYYVADYTVNHLAHKKAPFQKYIYGSIESGFPAIVVFRCSTGDCHAIPIFGHTFNEDTWVQRADSSYFRIGRGARYIPSESWVSMYIGHDDNWGSNYCIPRRYLHTRRECSYAKDSNNGFCDKQTECVVYVIGTLPKSVKTNPIEAEVLGAEYLFSILRVNQDNQDYSVLPWSNIWFRRLKQYESQLVLRPLLIKASEYPQHLSKVSDWEGEKIYSDRVRFLGSWSPDEWIWMIELSVPELFSANKRKVGEVVIKAEIAPDMSDIFSNFLLARIPGYFVTRDISTQEYEYWPSGADGHVELYGCEE